MDQSYDGIVLGAGAAGLMCAAEAGRRGRRIAVLESTSEPGRKILISGGGRCNFTNLGTGAGNFLSVNPHFMRSALARYTPADFLALVAQYRISWHEKKLGQLFCDRSAQDILDMLLTECRQTGVPVYRGCRIIDVRKPHDFVVETSSGVFRAPALIVATGGLSIPKLGASPFGYELARKFGLNVVPPRPALVPLVLNQTDRNNWCDLAGVAVEARVSFERAGFNERCLITHRGLSGPAILQISSYWDSRHPLTIDLLPGGALAPGDTRFPKTMLARQLPKRFAERWIDLHGTSDLEAGLHRWQVLPSGTEGYTKAEVTAGGVDANELSSKTMESRRVSGLYFIGEVVDVTGQLGGYNFQWAWASAVAAGEAV